MSVAELSKVVPEASIFGVFDARLFWVEEGGKALVI